MLGEPLNKAGEEATKQQTAEIERLIQQEGQKIQAYEAAFGQIKEATGVADVNEVIQKFLSQEETHQNLLQMTRDSQGSIDSHREALDRRPAGVAERAPWGGLGLTTTEWPAKVPTTLALVLRTTTGTSRSLE